MKRVYITGIAGLLGNNLVKVLKEYYVVGGADRNKIEIFDTRYDVLDLLDLEKLRESIKRFKPDVIIHTAAMINVDTCEKDYAAAYDLNVSLTAELANICKENEIKLIYISTDSVYDGETKGNHTEDENVNPINIYALTKLQGENEVRKSTGNLVLRTNIYGINIQNKKSFGEWVAESLYDNQILNMFEDIYFSPILVDELADVIHRCIELDISGLYNVCGTGSITKYDFGVKLKEIFGIETGQIVKANSSIMQFEAKRPKNMGMSNNKICNSLGIRIRTPEESIIEFKKLYFKKYYEDGTNEDRKS